jgi:hypothetical protein
VFPNLIGITGLSGLVAGVARASVAVEERTDVRR